MKKIDLIIKNNELSDKQKPKLKNENNIWNRR